MINSSQVEVCRLNSRQGPAAGKQRAVRDRLPVCFSGDSRRRRRILWPIVN